MKNIEYSTLKFKHTVVESEPGTLTIFEERRELIEWYLERMHVYFSKRVVADALAILSIIMGIVFVRYGVSYAWIPFSFSLLFLIARFRLIAKYRMQNRCMRMGLALLDKEIYEKYNMKMEDPL